MQITQEELENAAKQLGIELYEWQKRLIYDRATRKWCLNCGRKAGKTQTVILRCAWALCNADIRGSGLYGGILIVSNGQEQAKQILYGVRDVLSILGWTFSDYKSKISEDDKVAYASVKELQMPNGNRILALPTGVDGKGLRPYSMHEVIKDECDYLTEDVQIAMSAITARLNGIELLESTPKGDMESYFSRCFHGKNPGYTCIHIKTEDVPHVPKEWLDQQRKDMDAVSFRREFEGAFAVTSNSVFSQDEIFSCINEHIDFADIESKCQQKYMGIDVARLGECDTVFCWAYIYNGVAYFKLKVIEHARLTEIEGEVTDMLEKDRAITKCVIDEGGGMGVALVDALVEKFGENRIEGVVNYSRMHAAEGTRGRYLKTDMYQFLKAGIERGQVKFSDMRIAESLLSMRYEYKRSGDIFIWGRSSDIAEAVVRAFFPTWSNREWTGDVRGSLHIS